MGFEQPGLVKDVPARGRRVGLDDLQMSLPTQTILLFCLGKRIGKGHSLKRKQISFWHSEL